MEQGQAATTPRRSRRAWWIAGVVVVVGAVVPQVVISIWGATLASRRLSQKIEKPVTIRRVSGGWWGALEIEGLKVSDSFGPKAGELLEVGWIRLGNPLWMLLFPDAALDVAIDDFRLELRRLPNGEWNVAALQPARGAEPPEELLLPRGPMTFQLTRGTVNLAAEDRAYSLTAHAHSPSLRDQPMEWDVALSAGQGESLTASGSLTNLADPREISGSAKVAMTHFDLSIMPALVPDLPRMYADGAVEHGGLELNLTGFRQFRAQANFDLRHLSLLDAGEKTDTSLDRASVRFDISRDNDKWTIDTLSVEGDHGQLRVEQGTWFDLTEAVWRGKVTVNAALKDSGPASRALTLLFPEPLTLGGSLRADAEVEGEFALDPQTPFHERLTGLTGHLNLALAEARWEQERFENVAAEVGLENDRLAVTRLEASVGGGQVSLQGALTITGNQDGGLSWRVVQVPLAGALGPTVQTFDVTRATGRLTFDGQTYRVESQTVVRELNLDRNRLGNRELRITDATLDCAGTLPANLARFDVSNCGLKAKQGNLSSQQGQIEIGETPNLDIGLKGWLGGPFLNALVPEIKAKWPGRVHVAGRLMVPFEGETWPAMTWDLNANGEKVTYGDMEFSPFRVRVTKALGRLDFDMTGRRSAGTINAAGGLELGDQDVLKMKITAARLPFYRKLGGPYTLAATFNGSGDVTIDSEGEFYLVRNDLSDVELRRDGQVVGRLAEGKLEGELRRTAGGSLWAKNLSVIGDQLSVRVRDSHLPLEEKSKIPLKLDLEFSGAGSWLALAAAIAGFDKVEASGQSHLSLRAQGALNGSGAKLSGTGALKVSTLSLWGRPLSDADLVFDLAPQSVKITRSSFRYEGGRVALQGNIIFPIGEGHRGESLVLEFDQVPLRHVHALSDFQHGGPATLATESLLSGALRVLGLDDGQLAVTAEIKSSPISRRVLRQEQSLAAVQLPALDIKAQLTSRTPLQHWAFPSLTIRGQGTSIEFSNGQLRSGESSYEATGQLAAALSPEALKAITIGVLPSRFDLNGRITASGLAEWRIPFDRPSAVADFNFAGNIEIDRFKVDADSLTDVRLAMALAGGRLQVRNGEASMLGGRLWLPSPFAADLRGPAHPFTVHIAAKDLQLRGYGGRQVSLQSFLGLLLPVFLFRHDAKQPTRLAGVLQTELQITGTYQNVPGWSRSVNGDGSFRITDGAVVGSSLISGIIARSLLMPTNIVHNAIAELFSPDGQVGREIASLGDRAFTFKTIESPITIRSGEISLEKNLKVTSPELTLTINGHSNLEGDVDYNVGTDLIRRVRLGEITDLPNRIPIIGRALRYINPFTLLDGIELQAKVRGNLLKTGPDGRADVRVETSVVDTKAG